LFEQGFYFADTIGKVLKVTEKIQVVVVAEVALGCVQEVSETVTSVVPSYGFNSVRFKSSKQHPDPHQSVLWRGELSFL
jgi:hypothetical protein